MLTEINWHCSLLVYKHTIYETGLAASMAKNRIVILQICTQTVKLTTNSHIKCVGGYVVLVRDIKHVFNKEEDVGQINHLSGQKTVLLYLIFMLTIKHFTHISHNLQQLDIM